MKTIMTIKTNTTPADILKETPAERAERMRYSARMRTQIVPNKKRYNRKKLGKVSCDD